jgi:hypothetical protein
MAAPKKGDSGILDSGTLRVETKQLDATTFSLILEVGIPDVVAALVHVPGDAQDLLRVTASDAEGALKEAALGRSAKAKMSLGLPALEGRLSYRLEYDASQTRALEVTLVRRDGAVTPITLNGAGFASGINHLFEFGRRGCYTVSVDCHCDSNGENCTCHASKECCTFPPSPCVDCTKCEVTCGPCNQPPPA